MYMDISVCVAGLWNVGIFELLDLVILPVSTFRVHVHCFVTLPPFPKQGEYVHTSDDLANSIYNYLSSFIIYKKA